MGNLTFTPYVEEYWDEIAEVFRSCFGHEYSRELWEWKYKKNPFGQGRILTAWQGDRLVGQYAAYPVLYRACDGSVWSAQHISDVMISPRARGNGVGHGSVLSRLTRDFYKTMCADKVFNYGCPMIKHMRLGKLVLDYHDVGAAKMWECHPRASFQESLIDKIGCFLKRLSFRGSGFRVRIVNEINADWANLFAEVGGQYGLLVARNIAYLAWRYAQPGKQYLFYEVRQGKRLVLWAVLEQRSDELVIGDMIFDLDNPMAFSALILNLTLRYAGLARIHLWGGDQPGPWAAILSKVGFVHKQVEIPVHLAASIFHNKVNTLEQLNGQRYYAMGDFDLF